MAPCVVAGDMVAPGCSARRQDGSMCIVARDKMLQESDSLDLYCSSQDSLQPSSAL